MDREDELAFTEWAASRLGPLVRFGFALTHDEGGAEDLVASALARTFLEWPDILGRGDPEHYTRRVMVHELGASRRHRRRAEVSVREVESNASQDGDEAVLVLRYYEGRSEPEVAELLGCSVESVRNDASEGIATLRAGELLDDRVSR